jgi:transketolase C-terminal domain/subunit
MSILPNMTVVAPGDPNEVRHLLPQLVQLSGPSYLRIGRFGEPTYDAEAPAVLGRARLLRKGERVAVVSTGDIASVVVEAVDSLRPEGICPLVYQMHTVKPLDMTTLDSMIGEIETIIVVEEHLPIGGLFAAVSAWRVGCQMGPKLVRLGAPDALMLGSPDQKELRHRINCDAESIVGACRSEWALLTRAQPLERN